MRRFVAFVCAVLMLPVLVPMQPGMAAEPNPKPKVIPSLQEWTGGTGAFTLGTSSRITVDPDHADVLMATADVFQRDLKEVTGETFTIETTAAPVAGDIFLTMNDQTDDSIGEEGYFFEVEDMLTIRANTPTGVFYGTRTALQILVQDPEGNSIAKGVAKDYPKYEVRGFMLDVGRKFFPMDFLEDYVKMMSWYKMNDFHVHLNDNAIFKDNSREHWDAYSAFRLESETYPELTAKDGHYTKEEFREFQDLAKKHALTITPEFDTPSHALAFTKVRPDLVHPDLPVDHLDITREETVEFVKSVWDEYLDLFDAEQVHIGADEFYRNDREMSNVYREYINTLHRHLKKKGKTARAWGGLTYYKGDVPVDQDVVFNAWNVGWYNPVQAINEGYKIINTDDSLLYIVPKAGYYHDYLNTNWLYNNWEPNVFGGSIRLDEDEPNLLGGMFAVWNDMLGKKVSVPDVHDRISHAMPTLAEKMWRGTSDDATFAEFKQLSEAIGIAPRTNLEHEVVSESETVIHYSFDEETGDTVKDMSGNNYDGTLTGAKRTDDGKSGQAIQFNNPTDHIKTGLDTKGFPWSVSALVKLEADDQSEAILLESPYGAIKLKQKETGNAGFTREGYDFSFDTAIPTDRWVHVGFRGDLSGTSLFIDGELQETLPDNILLPVETIGSKTSAFKGMLDELIIYDRLSNFDGRDEYRIPQSQMTATATSEEEGVDPAEHAIDGKPSTIWHTDWNLNDPLPQSITLDLGGSYHINEVTYLPRQDGSGDGASNGIITKYKLYVSNDGTNFMEVASGNWPADKIEKTIRFDAVDATHVKLEAIEGVRGFASAAELNVYIAEEQDEVEVSIPKMLETLEDYREEIISDTAYRSLQLHLTAVGRYEDKDLADKVVKHMESFKALLDYQKDNDWISEKAYNTLQEDTDHLIRMWQ